VAVGAPERADDPVIRTAQLTWRATLDKAAAETDWTPAERACRALAGIELTPTAPQAVSDDGDAAVRSLWLLAGHSPSGALTPSAASCAPAAAELAGILVAARAGQDHAAGRGVAGWLDRRRPLAWTLLGLAALLFIAAVVWSTLTRDTLTASTVETRAGLAARYYAEGRYDDALALYTEIHQGGRHVMRVEGQIANAHFRAGRLEQAATWYEQAVASSPQAPGPALNLALTLHRLGPRRGSHRALRGVPATFRGRVSGTGRARAARGVDPEGTPGPRPHGPCRRGRRTPGIGPDNGGLQPGNPACYRGRRERDHPPNARGDHPCTLRLWNLLASRALPTRRA
jgi:hypothetical protein